MDQTISKPLASIGFKPNASYFHNTMRIVAAFALLVIIVVMFYFSTRASKAEITLRDIEDVIKPGTAMHTAIDEMDEESRTLYVAALNRLIHNSDDASRIKKITRSLSVAIVSGIIAEYIMHGSMSKTIGILGKTSINTVVGTMAS